MLKGKVKWFSGTEGRGIIATPKRQYCFSVKDVYCTPQIDGWVKFTSDTETTLFHNEEMPVAKNVKFTLSDGQLLACIFIAVLFATIIVHAFISAMASGLFAKGMPTLISFKH